MLSFPDVLHNLKLHARGMVVAAAVCTVVVPASLSQLSAPVDATQAMPERTEAPPPSAYAGDAACAQCHRKESEFYGSTPHALDSAIASPKNVLGNFHPGHNILHTTNPNLIVKMTERPDGFYQTAENLANPANTLTQRMDTVIGSGRHGQTYLYWDGDQLFELPVSYWGWNHDWVISPGMPPNQIHFDRPIVPRCLECHGSYFKSEAPPLNRFEKSSLVLGIGCERCHGPGAEHVARERSAHPPTPGSAQEAIVNPAHLTKDRQLGLCSLCHAGAVEPTRPPLTFIAGDDVHDFLDIQPAAPGAAVDVHGNQVGTLELSKCFASGKLTCSTCHNVHVKQENADAFSRHCLSCHEVKTCPRYKALGAAIRTRCVDCHMPLQDSAKITSDTAGQQLHALLRMHRIAVYPEASARVERGMARK